MYSTGRVRNRRVWSAAGAGGARGGGLGHGPNLLRKQRKRSVPLPPAPRPPWTPLLASARGMTTALEDLKLHSSGKVREIYELDGDLIMVASDRISAYDVVMPNPIPDKGRVLTQMSIFWFEITRDISPTSFPCEEAPPGAEGRGIRVRKLEMYPVECVVRGYLSGSGWREYKESGAVCGIELPEGLVESDKLPEPIFTPATKAEI